MFFIFNTKIVTKQVYLVVTPNWKTQTKMASFAYVVVVFFSGLGLKQTHSHTKCSSGTIRTPKISFNITDTLVTMCFLICILNLFSSVKITDIIAYFRLTRLIKIQTLLLDDSRSNDPAISWHKKVDTCLNI